MLENVLQHPTCVSYNSRTVNNVPKIVYNIDVHKIYNRYSSTHSLKEILDECVKLAPDKEQAMRFLPTLKIIPSGRLLHSVGAYLDKGSKFELIPSCCVLSYHSALRNDMLGNATGIGSCVNNISTDVFMDDIIKICSQPKLVNGRIPGLMLTIYWRDPNAITLIRCKRRVNGQLQHATLKNVNISVVVLEEEFDEFIESNVGQESVLSAWMCGDPGWLIVPRDDPRPREDKICQATAPCGELWLDEGEACTLGDVVLPMFYDQIRNEMNWSELKNATAFLTRYLDHLISYMTLPDFMKKKVLESRRIGIGVVGFADLLDVMGIAYNSQQAVDLASRIGYEMRASADAASQGRNKTRLAFPPTGGIASLSAIDLPSDNSKIVMSNSIEPHFPIANSISVKAHIDIVAAFQEYVDGGVSKTINMRNDCSVSDIKDAVMAGAKAHMKGITVFRDGCLAATTCTLGGKCTSCRL